MTELDKKSLVRIATKNETAEAVFTILATRERNRKDMNLKKLNYTLVNNGFRVVPEELIETFRDLEKAGLGKLEASNSKSPRFRWFVSLKDVGIEAVQHAPKVQEVPKPLNINPKIVTEKGLTMVINGKEVSLHFPSNLSKDEVKLISENWLQEIK